jgi:hypothetical protein
MDVFSMEQGIRHGIVKTSEFRGGGVLNPIPPRYATGLSHPTHDENTYVIQCAGGCEMFGTRNLSGGPKLKW